MRDTGILKRKHFGIYPILTFSMNLPSTEMLDIIGGGLKG